MRADHQNLHCDKENQALPDTPAMPIQPAIQGVPTIAGDLNFRPRAGAEAPAFSWLLVGDRSGIDRAGAARIDTIGRRTFTLDGSNAARRDERASNDNQSRTDEEKCD